ncbi:YdcF family protein [Vibrio mediterranei]|uniref:YdcF family protein n=1 Tax=Vibrio mediterranei TaxID=689 RepID=A0A3G4VKU5_9VIBR|nr:YdcF family protein [Vibrio mediterranei]AYV24638.1 YdcF family protein [Vibrio mediterranei]
MKEKEFDQLIVVLGKRLNNNALTLEGMSRVEEILRHVGSSDCSSSIIAFCGGVTNGQSVSEARLMFEAFEAGLSSMDNSNIGAVLLEEESTSTVENIIHLSEVLLESELLQNGAKIEVKFVSNDYHLERMFTIQSLLDEQGLLRYLKSECQRAGLNLTISSDIKSHFPVPYPHYCVNGQLFLLLDELTTYRVYLEGVRDKVFRRPLSEVIVIPLSIAHRALAQLEDLVSPTSHAVLYDQLPALKAAVERTSSTENTSDIENDLSLFDTVLNYLNRCLDPERDESIKWWR